jgi:hypothetical protein
MTECPVAEPHAAPLEPNAAEWIARAHANAGQCELMARAGAAMYRALRLTPCTCLRTGMWPLFNRKEERICRRCAAMQVWEQLIKGEVKAE